MKKFQRLLLIAVVVATLVSSTACNYNGHATIVISNVGELSAVIRVMIGYDEAYTSLEPGETETYNFSWPGHDSQTVTYIRYPKDYSDDQFVDNLIINDGDYLELEVKFYLDDFTGD